MQAACQEIKFLKAKQPLRYLHYLHCFEGSSLIHSSRVSSPEQKIIHLRQKHHLLTQSKEEGEATRDGPQNFNHGKTLGLLQQINVTEAETQRSNYHLAKL